MIAPVRPTKPGETITRPCGRQAGREPVAMAQPPPILWTVRNEWPACMQDSDFSLSSLHIAGPAAPAGAPLHAANLLDIMAGMQHGPGTDPAQHPARTSDVASQTGRAFVGIREMLLRGEFRGGERISEIPLSERLGMSRTPIRLALERLAHLGLLDTGPSGGFHVRIFTMAEVHDAIELRGVLEGTAARLAVERYGSAEELTGLRDAYLKVDQDTGLTLDSFSSYMDHNELFHAAILDLAKSAMLRRMIEQANSLPFASPSAMVFPTSLLAEAEEWLTIAREQHRALLVAIENREGARAEHLAREHARLAWRVFEIALSDKEVLNGVPGGRLIALSG